MYRLYSNRQKKIGIKINAKLRFVQNKTALLYFDALLLPLRLSNALVLLIYEIKTEMKKRTDWSNILD
jgi:hypothetical protein